MLRNKTLRIAIAASLALHAILGGLALFLLKNLTPHAIENPAPKKVKMSFKRGGDVALKNSPFKENTALLSPPPMAKDSLDSPRDSQDSRLDSPKMPQDSPPKIRDSAKDSPRETPQDSIKDSPQDSAKDSQKDRPKLPTQLDLANLSLYDGQKTGQPQNAPNAANPNPAANPKKSTSSVAQLLSRLPNDLRGEIAQLYGDELGDYGEAERDFIINNLRDIGRITQYHLNARGYPPDAGYLAQQGQNAVEFYLHPNGDISALDIIAKSGSMILDKNTLKTIQIAYKDYPRPTTRTKIKIFVKYILW